jgi:uncharacterized OB-fold protein
MGFERFGVVSYTKETKVAEFVKFLENGKVVGTACKKCGTKYFPPKADCPQCLSSISDWFEIDGQGRLITYAVVNYGPVGFEDKAPYILGIADFGDGLQALAPLNRDIKQDEIKIGMILKIKPIQLTGNKISYEFNVSR